ncbi:MAG: Hsp20/alpha crystallin family protein [Gammaproteobacteria bacterium]|nr:Hsp20/alpha crystallin family protein [Gammaproteobacteria bacterium]
MTETRDLKTQENKELEARGGSEAYLRPVVDIFEDANGITLMADLPGVSSDRLNIEVDRNTLAIEGQVSLDMPKEMEALYADVRATRYQRSFTLSNELDTDAIKAEMKDGVLTLNVPKRAEHQPRRIQVNGA